MKKGTVSKNNVEQQSTLYMTHGCGGAFEKGRRVKIDIRCE